MAHILELSGPDPHDGERHTVNNHCWRLALTDNTGYHDYRVHNRTPHHIDPEEGLPVYIATLSRHPSVHRPT